MEISEVRVSLRENPQTRLKAYATLTFDRCFVVRNVKIIEGKNGLFVAMPSRKPKMTCQGCHFKNDLGSRFCNQCGAALSGHIHQAAGAGDLDAPEAMMHRDIAHPITVECRQRIQRAVLDAYETEKVRGEPVQASAAGAEDYEVLESA
ncbi:MAG: septation protein SpoVG family protein [Candidatus Omnitrophica bacterium]|nr:septation protein SpoVG family protein [Candidatus Omnitrophota bacterium]